MHTSSQQPNTRPLPLLAPHCGGSPLFTIQSRSAAGLYERRRPSMTFKISENVGNIIRLMKELIENDKAIRIKQDKGGWEYAGSEFKSLVISLKENLVNEGHNVRGCTIWHFFRGANIKNPTKGLIILSINGSTTLSPGGPLTSDSFSYIKDEPSLLAGAKGVDVAFAVLEPEGAEKKDGAKDPDAAMETVE